MMDHDIIIASEVDVPEGMEEQLRKVILAALAAQGVDQGARSTCCSPPPGASVG